MRTGSGRSKHMGTAHTEVRPPGAVLVRQTGIFLVHIADVRSRWNTFRFPGRQPLIMTSSDPFPSRKRPAKGIIAIEGQPTIVFDTICTQGRVAWLANAEVHALLVDVWTQASAWVVGRYMIMPDHIHLFAGYRDGVIAYDDWVKYWKSRFSNRYGRRECRFQTGSFDHRVRNAASYEAKWQYVRENPVRAGLVKRSEDWPYQGEIHALRWD